MSQSFYRKSLPENLTVLNVQRAFEDCGYRIVLDSSRGRSGFDARYSFLTADPIQVIRRQRVEYGQDLFADVRALQRSLPPVPDDAPPFCGGIAGLMGYEIGRAFERLPLAATDSFETPDFLAGLYDWAIVWDHLESSVELWVLDLQLGAQGDSSLVERQTSGVEDRIKWVQHRLQSCLEVDSGRSDSGQSDAESADADADADADLSVTPEFTEIKWRSVFEPDEYMATVQRVIDYIGAGDVFQANLSQQLTAVWSGSASELFDRVCRFNPAPFCGLLTAPDFSVVSASPERFVKVDRTGRVETRPIKGTRRRQKSPVADLLVGDALKCSEKDRAENVMIVDLLRNDLSRVCRTGSVRVTGVCELEVFETVQHLVSTVKGRLRDDCDVWDLCAAALPGGSITGAPKIRAMEIIADLEPVVRGAYCGNLFYCGPHGDFDSSILIRTFTLKGGRVQFPVGGGIVSDSDPMDEYEETLHKASGMLRVLNGRRSSR